MSAVLNRPPAELRLDRPSLESLNQLELGSDSLLQQEELEQSHPENNADNDYTDHLEDLTTYATLSPSPTLLHSELRTVRVASRVVTETRLVLSTSPSIWS